MRINNSSLSSINYDLKNTNEKKCSPKKRAESLEKLLEMLDKCEHEIKNRMQDRMKFMSGKNAFRSEAQLVEIDETRERIRCELRSLLGQN